MIDWAEIEAAYVNSSISLKELAGQYGLTLRTVQKRSAKGKWSEKRRKYRERKAEKVCDKVNDKAVSQTVRELRRVVKAAGKLIDKVNKAINQVDKTTYISHDEKDITEREEAAEDGTTHVLSVKKRKIKTTRMDTLVDTKKVAELAKALVNLKDVLTGDNGKADTTEESGVIEIAAATMIDPREDEHEENGVEAPAEAGADDGAHGG